MRRTFAILCLFLASKSNVLAERSYGYAKKDELCNLDGLCINFLLEVTDLVLSKNECYLKCLRNLDCAWYTYNSKFGTCHLNMGCNDFVLLNQGFTRSYKDCEVLKSKLIVFGYSNRTEVIDLENPNNVCEDMAPNSNLLNHFSSGLINNNLPLVCGGLSQYHYYDDCFVVGRKSNTLIAQMKHPRSNAASLPLPDALWVLATIVKRKFCFQYFEVAQLYLGAPSCTPMQGGFNGLNYLYSSELVFLNGTTSSGPTPPITKDISIALLNDTTAILIGGIRSYFFHISTKTWIRGPDLKNSRTSEAGIATFYSEFHDKRLVAVIGGTTGSGSEGGLPGLTVELLDFNHDHLAWFAGPSGPDCNCIYGGSAVTNARQNGIVVIGPKPMSDSEYSLFELSCPIVDGNHNCYWKTLPQTVMHRGTGHALFLVVDDGKFNCTEIN